MSAITNFNPIQTINSFLKPLGLAVSSKQQVISKTTMIAFAALSLLQVANAGGCIQICDAHGQNCQRSCVQDEPPKIRTETVVVAEY